MQKLGPEDKVGNYVEIETGQRRIPHCETLFSHVTVDKLSKNQSAGVGLCTPLQAVPGCVTASSPDKDTAQYLGALPSVPQSLSASVLWRPQCTKASTPWTPQCFGVSLPQCRTPAPQVFAPDISEQEVVMSEEEQDALFIAASWDEESFLRGETQDPDLTQETVPSSVLASEPEVPAPSSSVQALMERAANFVSEQHNFLEEVKSSWQHPASVPSVSKSVAALASMEGAEAVGLAQFPLVDSTIAALVRAPSVGGLPKDPVCPNGQCRITEAHLEKAYMTEAQVMCLANTGGLLTAYLDGMLRSVTLPEPLASELRTVSSSLLQISGFQGQALGRSLAGLVVAHRQLWLSQVRVLPI
ncbi:UNVERIFIED_CONTAM: hypothetical protein FKN15_055371 [Acipenser sinensis]